jgi:acetylornithine deacetylase/succinyl-diaminopimelate desuccinylase-like protein
MKATFDYIEQNQERFVCELKSFLRFASVSAQTAHHEDVSACAVWLANHLAGIGLESRIIDTPGNPIVWARAAGDPAKRIIIYGHYDVQPAEPREKWNTSPFDAQVADGYIVARGATDDKGQLFAHVKAVESLLRSGKRLGCEVVFLIEGEEECGGNSLETYVKEHASELAAQAVIVSDSSMYDDIPAITYGLRGTIGFEIIVKGPERDVHSGSFGGAVPNPAVVLANILARCVDSEGTVLIPGFYDNVRPLEKWEQENLKRLAHDDIAFSRNLGIKKTFGDPAIGTLEKLWARPTFEINGIYGGYAGQGGKTIIPSQAGAKISCRVVGDQNPDTLAPKIIEFIKSVCPENVELSFIGPGWSYPVLFDTSHAYINSAAAALKAGFGKEPVFIREGGSIPVVQTFGRELKCPVILMGFGHELDGAHSPNERFKIASFINGAKTSASFLQKI